MGIVRASTKSRVPKYVVNKIVPTDKILAVSIDLFCVSFARFRTVEYITTDHQTTSPPSPLHSFQALRLPFIKL